MATSLYEASVSGDSRTAHQRGEIMPPQFWRDKHDLEHVDVVAVTETDDGRLEVIPPEPADEPDYPNPEHAD